MDSPRTTNGTPPSAHPATAGAPPHSIEAEQSVLGAILLSERVHYALVIEEALRPEDFYRERHRVIYESMMALYEASEPIDVLTVTEHLRSRGKLEEAGGQAEIDALTASVPAVGNLRRYGQIVKEHSLLRRVLGATYEIQASVHNHEGDPREIVERAEKTMLEVAHDDRQKDFRQVGEVLHEEIDKWQTLSVEGRSITGTPSGFADLDAITGGFQPGNLIIVAARPSMGKCCAGSTLVYDPWTGARRRLDDVVRDVEDGEEAWVASMGPDLKLRPSRPTAAFRSGVQPVYRITTKLGRTLTATENHPLFTIHGWRELRELSRGDRIALPRRLPRCGIEQTMPDHELVMLAALIADGNLTNSTPRFCFGPDSPVLESVEDTAGGFGLPDGHGWATISTGRGAASNAVSDLLRRVGLHGLRSEHKFVPDPIFGLDEERISRFLAVLYGCDGHVHANERLRQIGYTTTSERLARDVQHLLLRLGIVAKIRTLKRPVCDGTGKVAREVLITGREDLERFCLRVAVCGKTAALARVVSGIRSVRVKTNVDTLPHEAWGRVLAVKDGRSWADVSVATARRRNHNWHVGTRGLSRRLMSEPAEAMGSDDLRDLATSDLWWDEVASIEYSGEEETYDLTVAGDHNFVANDIVVHNSALVTNIAENVALDRERPRPVALFSLEMSEAELAQRFIASQAAIKGDDLRKGRLKDESKWRRVLKVAGEYDRSPLFVDDSSDIGILDVRAKARRLHQQTMRDQGGLGLIIVDYLQLMRADSRIENRVQQVGEMSRGLKILARELNVPVIALSQLSRGVESRTDKRPMLSDLRECVTGETLVVLADGRRVPIRDLVGTTPEVIAVDDADRVVPARSDRVWPVGRRPVLRVHLASGRALRATGEHRIRTDGGWRTVAGLAPGDGVALARRLPEPASPERLPEQALARLARHEAHAGLPGDVFRLSDDQVADLLRHLWTSGGTITSAPRPDGRRLSRVGFSASSAALAADVAALLLRLGIAARRTVTRDEEGAERHSVAVSGPADQRRFLDLVGADGRHAAAATRLRALLAATAPHPLGRTIGSTAVLEDPRAFPAPAGDLCWDLLVDVVPDGDEEVFDITVPGPACWLADGIVSHNSGQIEQDADLVMFIYRDEYYHAETTDRPGEADLIIAKHRNGGLGDVPLTFQNEYPRFLGLQRAA